MSGELYQLIRVASGRSSIERLFASGRRRVCSDLHCVYVSDAYATPQPSSNPHCHSAWYAVSSPLPSTAVSLATHRPAFEYPLLLSPYKLCWLHLTHFFLSPNSRAPI